MDSRKDTLLGCKVAIVEGYQSYLAAVNTNCLCCFILHVLIMVSLLNISCITFVL